MKSRTKKSSFIAVNLKLKAFLVWNKYTYEQYLHLNHPLIAKNVFHFVR